MQNTLWRLNDHVIELVCTIWTKTKMWKLLVINESAIEWGVYNEDKLLSTESASWEMASKVYKGPAYSCQWQKIRCPCDGYGGGDGVCHINKVELRLARLLLGLVTTFDRWTMPLFTESTQPGHPSVGIRIAVSRIVMKRAMMMMIMCDKYGTVSWCLVHQALSTRRSATTSFFWRSKYLSQVLRRLSLVTPLSVCLSVFVFVCLSVFVFVCLI